MDTGPNALTLQTGTGTCMTGWGSSTRLRPRLGTQDATACLVPSRSECACPCRLRHLSLASKYTASTLKHTSRPVDQSKPPSCIGYGCAVSCDYHHYHCCYCCPSFDCCVSDDENGSTSAPRCHPSHASHSHAAPCHASSSRAFSPAHDHHMLFTVSR